ncbi:MAG TPA: 23S rRNA (uracil(1939)-C(5))-methyltransferase RlmD [Candidatus Baltobacteraceae bacterium]|nr:23S rRNA (uracil(1939)-C(5))-methyltransferase RlmD [Candidatus Baltobacteraceae bacterium]
MPEDTRRQRTTTPPPLRSGTRLVVHIEQLVFRGDGLGRLPDGRVIFVPLTVPGDDVEIQVEESRADFARGRVVRIVSPAPDRIEAACPYSGTCGGCQWQQVQLPAQHGWKRRILQELLIRVGKLADVPISELIAPVAPWEYRARAQFKVIGGARPCIGYHQRETNRVVDIARCPLVDPRLNAVLDTLRRMKQPSLFTLFDRLREMWVSVGTGTGDVLVSLFARVRDRAALRLVWHRLKEVLPTVVGVVLLEGDPREDPRVSDHVGKSEIYEQVEDARFRLGPTAFFQVNGVAAGAVTGLLRDEAQLSGRECVLELYAGVGTFTVPLSRRAKQIVGVEGHRGAAADGEANLQANGCENARIIPGQVEQVVPGLATEGSWDVVVMDPPRTGCSRRLLEEVRDLTFRRLLYVSCDPSTLARDLGILVRSGLRLVRVQPIDLLPQTFHLESLAVLER